MTSHDQPSYCESCNRYPYIGKVSVGEGDSVDFVYQFVKKRFVEKPHQNPSIFVSDILGPPIKFPDYEEFPDVSVYFGGFDISISPWQKEKSLIHNVMGSVDAGKSFKGIDIIDIEFHEAVYPIRISIYEMYNPGSVIKIWAQDPDDDKCWSLLWDGLPQLDQYYWNYINKSSTLRLFSPPLRSCNFKTKMLRLECINLCTYYTKIDAVMLIGTSEMILPKNPEDNLTNLLKRVNSNYFDHEDIHNLTEDYKTAHLDIVHLQKNFLEYCIICKSDIKGKKSYKSDFKENLSEVCEALKHKYQIYRQRGSHYISLNNYLKCAKYIESKELSSDYSLSLLPDKIIMKILKNLDLTSLCYMNQVNKRFNSLTRDPLLYTRLNMRNVSCWKMNHSSFLDIFRYFAFRCKYLQQLDLTSSSFCKECFIKILETYGSHLTHLRLNTCFVKNESYLTPNEFANYIPLIISRTCKNLTELDLIKSIQLIDDEGLSHLANLKNLEHLNLNSSRITTETLCNILRNNQRIRKLYLEHTTINADKVAIELKNLCPDLEVINLNSIYRFTSQAINGLADCKNLRKVNFCGVLQTVKVADISFIDDSFCKLLSSCQHLEEIHWSFDLTDRNLESLTQCKNLEQLYLYKINIVPHKYLIIFEQCPKLQKFYLIHCEINHRKISDCFINEWKERYPHVSVFAYTTYRDKYIRGGSSKHLCITGRVNLGEDALRLVSTMLELGPSSWTKKYVANQLTAFMEILQDDWLNISWFKNLDQVLASWTQGLRAVSKI